MVNKQVINFCAKKRIQEKGKIISDRDAKAIADALEVMPNELFGCKNRVRTFQLEQKAG